MPCLSHHARQGEMLLGLRRQRHQFHLDEAGPSWQKVLMGFKRDVQMKLIFQKCLFPPPCFRLLSRLNTWKDNLQTPKRAALKCQVHYKNIYIITYIYLFNLTDLYYSILLVWVGLGGNTHTGSKRVPRWLSFLQAMSTRHTCPKRMVRGPALVPPTRNTIYIYILYVYILQTLADCISAKAQYTRWSGRYAYLWRWCSLAGCFGAS